MKVMRYSLYKLNYHLCWLYHLSVKTIETQLNFQLSTTKPTIMGWRKDKLVLACVSNTRIGPALKLQASKSWMTGELSRTIQTSWRGSLPSLSLSIVQWYMADIWSLWTETKKKPTVSLELWTESFKKMKWVVGGYIVSMM